MSNILCIGHSFVIDNNRKFWSFFSKQGNNVDLVCPLFWSSKLESNLKFKSSTKCDEGLSITAIKTIFKGKNSFYFYSPFSLFQKLSSKKYDIIYVWQETWALSLFQIIIFKILTVNLKTSIYLNICENLNKHNSILVSLLEKFNCIFVEKLLCCDSQIDNIIKTKKLNKPCYYFPFPVDSKQFIFKTRIYPKKIIFGYIGRLSKEKGLLLLINIFDEIYYDNDNDIDFEFVIAGDGDLLEILKAKEYTNYIGLVPHSDAQKFYDKIDILILPSLTTLRWKEQFGRVLVEGAFSGCILVGSNSGAIPEVVTKIGYEKYIFKENDKKSLRNILYLVIKETRNNDVILIKKIHIAKHNAIVHFDYPAVTDLLTNLILNKVDKL